MSLWPEGLCNTKPSGSGRAQGTESRLRRRACPCVVPCVSALSSKASFLVSETAACVHFNSRMLCLSLPPPDLGQTSGDPSEQRRPPRPPPAWEKPAQNPQKVKQEDDGFTGVSGTVTSHMGGKDSVWMERTTNSNSGEERQLLQGPGSGEVRSPALRVGTLQVPRLG